MSARHLNPMFRKTAVAQFVAQLFVGGMMLGTAMSASAATCTWNPASGDWNVGANWSCGFVPANLDLAVIASGKTVTVTAAQPTTSVSNDGTVTISNNSSIGLTGSNTNNGVIGLNSFGNVTDLTINGAVSLNGSGSVQMSNTTANRILGTGATLTLGAGQSILGSGQVGAGGSLALINNGIVSATQGQPLAIHTTAGVTNNNVLRANGGTLVVQNTAVNQGALGSLDAINGSTVQLSNASITGGSFTSSGGGAIATASGTTNALSGVTNTGTFNVVNNSFVNLDGHLVNNGTLNLQSGGNVTDLTVTGARTISGTGTINLSNTQANRINGTGGTLTLGSGQTLQGAGMIGAGSAGFGLVNQGTVIASSSAGLLINAAVGVTNTGTLRADGGALHLQTTVNSAGGNIEALNGSQVQLLNGAVINNANFSASGAGSLITTVGGATVTLGGGTVSGPMTIANNSFVRQTGNLTYNGVLSMASGGNVTDLQIDGVRSVTGAATINMSNTQANRIVAANGPGDQFTLGNTVTLQGAGQLGAGTALAVVNNGTVIATQSAGLRVETTAGVTNNGVMRADGGPLQFRNVVVNSAGGSIEAVNGSQVQLENGTVINNANFGATSAGLITTVSGATVTLGGGTVSGPMTMANNSFLRLTGDVNYNGTLSMASVGNTTDIQFDGVRTIGGTATLNLSNTQANRLVAANASGDSATLGSGITVQGAGSIGAGTALAVINNGSLIANSSAGMVLSTPAGATNNALIRGDGATFTIANTQVNQGVSGVFNAINNGAVVLNTGTQINGGTFSTALGGEVAVRSGNTASIAGVTNTGTLNVNNNAFLNLNGTLTNNGSVNLQSVGNSTDLRADGNQSILGTGTINMTNTTANRILGVAAGNGLTLGAGQTLQGAGSIGAGTNFNFTNNGTMLGNVSGALTFSSTGTVFNNALVRADAGNVVVTGGTAFGQSGSGVLSAINSGVVTINGNAVVSGGTLTTADTGQFVTTSGQTATLANVVTAGTFNVVNNSNLVLQGTVTNNGSLNLQSVGNLTNLLVSGPVTLAGNGVTNLSNSTANSISAQGAGAQLTVGAGQTIQGSGQFGAGTGIALVNQGTITANQSSPMTIAMTGPVSNASGGLMQAVAGGTLNVNSALANNGSLAANGGVVNANAAFNGTGTALISGVGQLNVGASSTVGTLTHNSSAASGLVLGANNITVSGDYTNANAGTGNSFNRRANVTGTGQILAGGNAAQAITGTGVSNGNTTNATLTINNVRVGATTFNYQVANTGSTGPSLRGAIQTNVNGGNLTDARLSGAGVTASNYNTGAPGSNTGNLGVTFTAAGAGALAPLSGQVLNLRSNFDNIADQKLNIVLGATAAAYNAAVGNTTPSPVQVANQRIGGGNTAALTVANTAVAGAFSEDLNASFGTSTGAASGSGSIAGRLAGTNNTGAGAMAVAVNTGSAGAKTGTVTLNYQTAGAVNGISNGLGTASVGNQVITVNGNVFQSATGAIQTAALNFGTVQVGQSVSQNLTIRNTATGASGFVEDLNASFGSASGTGAGLISGSGSLNGILAGTNSTAGNGVMTVAVNTAAAGTVAGSIGVNYFTAGAVNGVSNGLGTAAAGSEAYGVNGLIQTAANVINQANPVINNSAINLGNVRIGSASPSAFVSVTNQATIAPQAALNASISGNALITGSGSFNLLAPGATNSNSLQVGMDTSTAGARNGTATISFVSDASNVGNCAPNCQLNIASQNVSVAGGVYRLANAQNVTPSVTLAARVGDAAPSANVSITNQSPDVFTEALKVQAGVAPSGFVVGSNPANVAAQGTGAVQVSLTTATAGTSTGNLTLNHISTGAGTTNAADVSVGSSIVAMTGKIYTAAVGAVQSAVNFGIVHVGDVVAAQGVSVQNSAPVTALNDTLRASIGGAVGAFNTNNGVVAGLTAGGAANTTALTVGLSTASAGIYNGTALVGLNSHNPDMADLTLASQTVALNGTVNNYANAIFDKVHGAGILSRVGNQFILDFGTVLQNSGPLSSIIDVDNAVSGPADLLNGSLALLDGNDFASTLLLAGFSGVVAGGTSGDALSFLFDSTALGSFQDAVSLSWFGNNASGYQDQSKLYTLLVRGSVVQQGNTVPEPGTLALLLIAAVGAALARRRRTVAH